MSSRQLESHGPFTFIFKPNRVWYSQFVEVTYGGPPFTFTHKVVHFRDEYEFWSKMPVVFDLNDIEKIQIRPESAGARIFPRKFKKNTRLLTEQYPNLKYSLYTVDGHVN